MKFNKKSYFAILVTAFVLGSCQESCDSSIDIGASSTFRGHAVEVMFNNLNYINEPPGSYVHIGSGSFVIQFRFLSGFTFSETEWLDNVNTSSGFVNSVTSVGKDVFLEIAGLAEVSEQQTINVIVHIRNTPLDSIFQEDSLTSHLDSNLHDGTLRMTYFANPNEANPLVGPALVTNSWWLREHQSNIDPQEPLGITKPFSLGFSTNMGAVGVFPSECYNCNTCSGENQISDLKLGGIFINQCANDPNFGRCGSSVCVDEIGTSNSISEIDSSLYGFRRSNTIDPAVVSWVGKTGSPVKEAHSFINPDMKIAHQYEITLFGKHRDQFLASVPSSRRADNGTDLHFIYDPHTGLPLIGATILFVKFAADGFVFFGDLMLQFFEEFGCMLTEMFYMGMNLFVGIPSQMFAAGLSTMSSGWCIAINFFTFGLAGDCSNDFEFTPPSDGNQCSDLNDEELDPNQTLHDWIQENMPCLLLGRCEFATSITFTTPDTRLESYYVPELGTMISGIWPQGNELKVYNDTQGVRDHSYSQHLIAYADPVFTKNSTVFERNVDISMPQMPGDVTVYVEDRGDMAANLPTKARSEYAINISTDLVLECLRRANKKIRDAKTEYLGSPISPILVSGAPDYDNHIGFRSVCRSIWESLDAISEELNTLVGRPIQFEVDPDGELPGWLAGLPTGVRNGIIFIAQTFTGNNPLENNFIINGVIDSFSDDLSTSLEDLLFFNDNLSVEDPSICDFSNTSDLIDHLSESEACQPAFFLKVLPHVFLLVTSHNQVTTFTHRLRLHILRTYVGRLDLSFTSQQKDSMTAAEIEKTNLLEVPFLLDLIVDIELEPAGGTTYDLRIDAAVIPYEQGLVFEEDAASDLLNNITIIDELQPGVVSSSNAGLSFSGLIFNKMAEKFGFHSYDGVTFFPPQRDEVRGLVKNIYEHEILPNFDLHKQAKRKLSIYGDAIASGNLPFAVECDVPLHDFSLRGARYLENILGTAVNYPKDPCSPSTTFNEKLSYLSTLVKQIEWLDMPGVQTDNSIRFHDVTDVQIVAEYPDVLEFLANGLQSVGAANDFFSYFVDSGISKSRNPNNLFTASLLSDDLSLVECNAFFAGATNFSLPDQQILCDSLLAFVQEPIISEHQQLLSLSGEDNSFFGDFSLSEWMVWCDLAWIDNDNINTSCSELMENLEALVAFENLGYHRGVQIRFEGSLP